jgi:hypothetical protein
LKFYSLPRIFLFLKRCKSSFFFMIMQLFSHNSPKISTNTADIC